MITIAVCDDEKYIADQVKKLAARFFREKNMEASIVWSSCGEELLQYDKNIAILFRDIQMQGMDAMEAARTLRTRVLSMSGYSSWISSKIVFSWWRTCCSWS